MSATESVQTAPVVPTVLTLAEKTHRPIPVIEAELAAALRQFKADEAANREYFHKRDAAILRRERLKMKWKAENPTEPFDPTLYNPPSIVPPEDTAESRAFHASLYKIANLQAELDAAKKAFVGGIA